MRMDRLSPRAWQLLGEAESQVEQIAGAVLQPKLAAELHQVFLAKGVHGTTAIENNTLSEDEVLARIRGDLALPPSRAYLGQEVDNVVAGCNIIVDDCLAGRSLDITPERVIMFNGLVLHALELNEGVQPGVVRSHPVAVGNYRAVPAQDAQYLLRQLCDWLAGLGSDDERLRFSVAMLKAIMAHLYLAWIHSLEGFVDELREQIRMLAAQQLRVAWEHWVHSGDFWGPRQTPAQLRQRHLVLDLGDRTVAIKDLPGLTPRLARAYAGKQMKTVTRDLNTLVRLGLLSRLPGHRVRARTELMQAFLPLRA